MSLVEHLEKLRHFARLTGYRSINEGSQAMGISQAGLSKSIAGLEDVLSTKLFVRTNEGIALTKEGELVLQTTRRILQEASSLEINLRSLRASELPEKISIGMYDSIAIYFFPEFSSYLKAIYPTVELQLVVDTSANLAALLSKGQIQIAIGVNLNTYKDKSEFFLLFEDHYSFYVHPRRADELSSLPFIVHPRATDDKGRSAEEHLARLFKSRSIHRVYNFETVKSLTALGVGVGVLPTRVAAPLLTQKQLVSVSVGKEARLFGKHSIGFLTSKSFLKDHSEFAQDIYRLGDRWAKSQ